MAFDLSSLNGTNGFRIDGAAVNDVSGYSVSAAGDVNGDGIDDVIVGARNADPSGRTYAGSSYVVFGKATGFAADLDLATLAAADGFRLDGAAAYDRSGTSVSAAGDVNGDGIDDLIVGAYGADPAGRAYAGSSYVVFGKTTGFAAVLDLATLTGADGFRLDGAAAVDESGSSVSAAGDVNGDGIDDVIVGAPKADPSGRDYAGSSYVVFGKTTGFAADLDLATLTGTDGFRLDGASANDYSGFSVSAAGDVNGDGIDDLIVGAPFADPSGRYDVSASYVVFGKTTGFAADLDLATLTGADGFRLDGAYDRSGFSVSAAGDVNGDGFDDVIVGAPFADPSGRYGAGSSYVVFGKATGFAADLDLATLTGADGFRLDGAAAVDRSGRSVSAAGDVNGDGIDDLIVGAYLADPSGQVYRAGASYVVFGKTTGFAASLDLATLTAADGFRLDGAAARDYSGRSVSAAGDVNGDGFDDVIVGAPFDDPSGRDFAGSSYVIFGFATDDPINTITGTNGPDRLTGTAGADEIFGLRGNDTLLGRGGDDVLKGGAGRDMLEGEEGADTLYGGAGNDALNGGSGADRLYGGAGRDALTGGSGADVLTGHGGADSFIFGPGFGADTVTDFDAAPAGGQDRLDVRALGITAASFAGDVAITDLGADTRVVIAGAGSILLDGVSGTGPNTITQADFLLA